MISVEDWALIRRLVADDVPQRQVARDLGIGRATVWHGLHRIGRRSKAGEALRLLQRLLASIERGDLTADGPAAVTLVHRLQGVASALEFFNTQPVHWSSDEREEIRLLRADGYGGDIGTPVVIEVVAVDEYGDEGEITIHADKARALAAALVDLADELGRS